jgi:hypothetical protein
LVISISNLEFGNFNFKQSNTMQARSLKLRGRKQEQIAYGTEGTVRFELFGKDFCRIAFT